MNNDNEKLTTEMPDGIADEKLTADGCFWAFMGAMAFAIYGIVQFILWLVEVLT